MRLAIAANIKPAAPAPKTVITTRVRAVQSRLDPPSRMAVIPSVSMVWSISLTLWSLLVWLARLRRRNRVPQYDDRHMKSLRWHDPDQVQRVILSQTQILGTPLHIKSYVHQDSVSVNTLSGSRRRKRAINNPVTTNISDNPTERVRGSPRNRAPSNTPKTGTILTPSAK